MSHLYDRMSNHSFVIVSRYDGGRAMDRVEPDEYQTLVERRDYLRSVRIPGKAKLGWETTYDERECKALTWALGKLKA